MHLSPEALQAWNCDSSTAATNLLAAILALIAGWIVQKAIKDRFHAEGVAIPARRQTASVRGDTESPAKQQSARTL